MADKYGMERVTKAYLPRILKDWPTSLDEWDANEALAEKLYDRRELFEDGPDESDSGSLDAELVEPCAAIRLGRKHAINILPAAFYHLSRLEFVNWGLEYQDNKEAEGFFGAGRRTAHWELMKQEDWFTLEYGRKNIRSWIIEFANSGYQSANPPAAEGHTGFNDKGEPCIGLEDFWSRYIQDSIKGLTTAKEMDVLETIKSAASSSRAPFLCTTCQTKLQDAMDNGRWDFWDRLPQMFGLGVSEWNK